MNTNINIKRDIKWAFSYFLIAVLLGIFMRSVSVASYPFEFNYRNIVHTHSHIALLGWVYVLLSALLAHTFIKFKSDTSKKLFIRDYLEITIRNKAYFRYKVLFYITQFSVLGMLFSFPFQGYGPISISFSSIFIVCTYFYARFFLREASSEQKTISFSFVKMGIFYLVLSSIGIWMMPVAIVKFGKFSDVYMCAIAFFLHFQYNGWMLSSLMGLFIKKYQWDIQYPTLLKRVFILFQTGVMGSLFISWIGHFSYSIYYIIGGISVLLWAIAVGIIGVLYFKTQRKTLLSTVFISFFIIKVLVMLTGAFPALTPILYQNTDLLITYLHFNFLGVVSIGLLLFLTPIYKVNRYLIYIFLVAFISTEALIAYKGFSIWLTYPIFTDFYEWLWGATALFYFPAIGWRIGCSEIK